MIRAKFLRLASIPLSLSLAGCAAMINGSSQDVAFRSFPSGAALTIDGKSVGHTPTTVKLKRREDHAVMVEKDGHEAEQVTIESSFSGEAVAWSFVGALCWWGPFEWLVDFPLGSLKELNNTNVRVNLAQSTEPGDFRMGRSAPSDAVGECAYKDAFGRCRSQDTIPMPRGAIEQEFLRICMKQWPSSHDEMQSCYLTKVSDYRRMISEPRPAKQAP